MSLAPAVPEAKLEVLPLTPRLDVVDKLERFLELKAQSHQTEQAKSLLWRCAAEGRGVHPLGVLSVTEVRQAISGFEAQQLQPPKKNHDEATRENPSRHAARAKARPQVVKELARYLRSQTPTRRSNSEQLLRVAAQRRWEVSQVSGVSGIFTNDEVEKAIILGSGSKRSPAKSDQAPEAKAGAKSSSGASGAWHLLVEALRAEATEAAEAAQASQALPQATWAPGDGDEVDTEKSNSASHQEL